jgi:hypothetical protein
MVDVSFALVPLQASDTSLLALHCLATGIAAILSARAVTAVLPLTTTKAVRGACAGGGKPAIWAALA